MATIFLRTLIVFILVLIAVRLMGKREIGQLQPFELVVIIMIADVASVPMQDINIPLLQGLIPIISLLVGQLTFSYLNIKIPFFHKLFTGKSTILIEKGKILENNLKKQRYSLEGLLEQIRVAGYPDIRDVDYAILETSGQISVIPKMEKNQVTVGDMNIQAEYTGYPRVLILEGKIIENNILAIKKDDKWLNDRIREIKLTLNKILVLIADEKGNIYCQKRRG